MWEKTISWCGLVYHPFWGDFRGLDVHAQKWSFTAKNVRSRKFHGFFTHHSRYHFLLKWLEMDVLKLKVFVWSTMNFHYGCIPVCGWNTCCSIVTCKVFFQLIIIVSTTAWSIGGTLDLQMSWWFTTTYIKLLLICKLLEETASPTPPTAVGEICQRLSQKSRMISPLKGKHASNGTEPPMTREKRSQPFFVGYWCHFDFQSR